jgi:hypothetical protein
MGYFSLLCPVIPAGPGLPVFFTHFNGDIIKTTNPITSQTLTVINTPVKTEGLPVGLNISAGNL